MSSLHARPPAGAASLKLLAAVFAAGVFAGLVVTFPLNKSNDGPRRTLASATTDGRASTDAAAASEDTTDPCAGQTWPYIDSKCVESKAQETRQVRVIATDRGAPTTLATRTPRIDPKPAPRPEPRPQVQHQSQPQHEQPPQPQLAPAPARTRPATTHDDPPARVAATGAADRPTTETDAVASAPATAAPESSTSARADSGSAAGSPTPPAPQPAAAPKPHLAAAPAQAKPEAVAAPATNVDSDRKDRVNTAAPSPRDETKPARPATKAVTVRSAKRTARSKTAKEAPAEPPTGSAGLQRVPDPGESLGGPTVVRTYDFPDGRRVTVYQRPGSQAPSASSLSRRRGAALDGGAQALRYADDVRPARRVFVVPADGPD